MGASMCSQKEPVSPTIESTPSPDKSVEKEDGWVEVKGKVPNPKWSGLSKLEGIVPTHEEAVARAVDIARVHLQQA